MQTANHNIASIKPPARRSNGHLLFRFSAQLDIIPIGLTPEGLRMANSYEGTVSEGDFAGAHLTGTDNLLLRRDGVCVIDAHTLLTQAGGVNVYEHVHGYCLPPENLEIPSLDIVAQPRFEWPDIDFPIVGFSTFRAGASELEYLNSATARIDGWANFATGGLAIDTRLVTHDAEAPRLGTAA
ncbi:MAG: DUF3237 family protein [Lysobacterales bacterium]|jgi:hypothetical protein